MPVVQWANLERQWTARECAVRSPFEVYVSTDHKTLRTSATRVRLCSWTGPTTDRARLEVARVASPAFPLTVRGVLGTAWDDISEEWDLMTFSFVLASSEEARASRPVGVVGGVPTRRWTLALWLDPVSAAAQVTGVASLILDNGSTGTPFVLRATGVAP